MSTETESVYPEKQAKQRTKKRSWHSLLLLIGTWTLIAAVFLGLMFSERKETSVALMEQQEVIQSRFGYLTYANQLMNVSETLSTQLWRFAATGEEAFGFSYFDKMEEWHLREGNVKELSAHAISQEELSYLLEAKQSFDGLLEKEAWALRLLFEAAGEKTLPPELALVSLSEKEQALSKREKKELACNYIFGEQYAQRKHAIKERIWHFQESQRSMLRVEQGQENANLEQYMDRSLMLGLLMVSLLLLLQLIIYFLLIRPMSEYSKRLLTQSEEGCDYAPLALQGSCEMKTLGLAFNHVLSQLQEAKQLLQKQNEELTVLSKTDHLTKVLNRLAMENYMEKLLEEYRGMDWSIGLIMVDVDHFKQFNDSYGHPAGDDALRHVAEILRELVEKTGGLISRMGGEEFFILLPGRGENEVAALSQELLVAVREAEITVETGTKKGLTISMGSYVYHGGNETLKMLYTYADRALYAAKQQGRNRHVPYESLQGKP